MSKMLLLAMALVVACHPIPASERIAPAGMFADRVLSRDAWLDLTRVPEPLKVSSMPLYGGYYILYSHSGRFCVVDLAVWSTGPNDGQMHQCAWRTPRGPR